MVALEPGDLPSVLTLPRSPERFWMDRFPPGGGLHFFTDHTRSSPVSKDLSRSMALSVQTAFRSAFSLCAST